MSNRINAGLNPEAVQKRMADARSALERMQENSRVSQILLSVPEDACQACRDIAGTYPKDSVPDIPMEYCSHPKGCRSFYQPFLTDIFP
jgi:hypothetical protein